MASFTGLGRALRWIRQRQGKKQYEVADAASITKAMLSSYENEKQRPAIETLERILDSLEIDLDYLAYAIRVVRQEEERRTGVRTPPAGHAAPPALDTYHDLERTLGLDHRLDAAEEQAVAQMLEGFHGLLRYMLKRSGAAARGDRPAPERAPSPPPDPASDEEE